MSRRCCPSVEEGIAWGRGRWGCMALNSVRGKKKQKQQQGRMQKGESVRVSREITSLGSCGSCRSALCAGLQSGPILITSYGKYRTTLFSPVLYFSNSRWLIKKPFTFSLLSCLLCALPCTLTTPSLIPESPRTSKRLSAHKRDSSSSFIPASSSTTSLLFRTLCVRQSHFLVQAWANYSLGAICSPLGFLSWAAKLEKSINSRK